MDETLQLSSPAFEDNGFIPVKYTADGQNVSPPLSISGVGADTRSLAIIVDDPDAALDPEGPGIVYDHWVVFNVDPATEEVSEDSVPEGAIEGKNSADQNNYTGPAPPTGVHRYFFRLYALSGSLDLDENATKEDVQAALKPFLIEKAELIGKYQSSKS